VLNLRVRRHTERGAVTTIVAILLGFGVVMGMSALVIDVGNLYAEREQLQSGADAGAYAVARACVTNGCDSAAGVATQVQLARRFAERNATDGQASVSEVCGRWGALPACDTPATNLTRCLRDPDPTETYVEVRVHTRMPDGSPLLPPTFAGGLAGDGFNGTKVGACARVSAVVEPAPAVGALWADSTTDVLGGALSIRSAYVNVTGLVHSNANLVVAGSLVTLPSGVEYVTTMQTPGSLVTAPNPRRVAARPATGTVNVADYRPGGSRASGANYTAIPASQCVAGRWAPTTLPTGIVYVPCGFSVSSANVTLRALVVAEGPISIRGSAITVDPGVPGSPALVSASNATPAIEVAGSNNRVYGSIQALNGRVDLLGSNDLYQCGVIAKTIDIGGSYAQVRADSACSAGTGRTRLWLSG